MSIPYGYYLTPNGHVVIDQEKANIVRMIYQQYLSGMSLGGIADFLFKSNIPSTKGVLLLSQPARPAADLFRRQGAASSHFGVLLIV